jgi:hypothetical protein
MKQVERYGEYRFVYRTEYVPFTDRVSVHVTNGTIKEVLEQALKGLALKYQIFDNLITVRPDSATARLEQPQRWVIEGIVIDENGDPLVRATVQVSGTQSGALSKSDGQFNITVKPNTLLTFSCVGYEQVEKLIKDPSYVTIKLKSQVKDLDETVITGYGKTSKRYNTGSIFKINSIDIARQPVSDPLAALQGRVPGLLISQSNGLPGSTYKVQLRGQSSIGIVPGILPPNDPLS